MDFTPKSEIKIFQKFWGIFITYEVVRYTNRKL